MGASHHDETHELRAAAVVSPRRLRKAAGAVWELSLERGLLRRPLHEYPDGSSELRRVRCRWGRSMSRRPALQWPWTVRDELPGHGAALQPAVHEHADRSPELWRVRRRWRGG